VSRVYSPLPSSQAGYVVSVLNINHLESRGNYSATSNRLVHWPLMGGLLRLVQRGGAWAGPQPAQAPPRCTKCNSPPINGQCTNHRIVVRCCAVLMCPQRVNGYSWLELHCSGETGPLSVTSAEVGHWGTCPHYSATSWIDLTIRRTDYIVRKTSKDERC